MPQKVPKEILELIKSLPSKRAKIVIQHIIEHGHITTEELEKKYGYSHPPRAARDVRESGIPLETFTVKSSDGRNIAAYKLGDLSKIENDKLGGRTVFSKDFKKELYESSGSSCGICCAKFHRRYLQVDHRIPYEVSGDCPTNNKDSSHYMLVCTSCNRAKSWSCEHCTNWQNEKLEVICSKCYWANPESYNHVALQEIRRLDVVWTGDEIEIYEKLKKKAQSKDKTVFIAHSLRK